MPGSVLWAALLFLGTPCASEAEKAQRNRGDAQLFFELMQCWIAAGRVNDWRPLLPPAKAAAPSGLRFALGTALARGGYFRDAIQQLEAIPPGDRDAAVAFNLGLAHSRLGEFDAARRSYFQAVDHDAKHVEAYFRVGLDFAAAGQGGKAIAWFYRAGRMAPERSDIAYALAEELINGRYYDSAEDVLKRALSQTPNDPLLRVAQGDLARLRLSLADAEKWYRESLKVAPKLTAARVGLARTLLAGGDTARAQELLRQVLGDTPSSADAHAEMARLLAESGDHRGAVEHFEKALSSPPYEDRLRIDLSRSYRLAQNPARAAAILEKMRVPADLARAYHLELAQAYRALKRDTDAKIQMELVRKLERRNEEEVSFVPPSVYVH